MRTAVLVKQVPRFEEIALGPDGRLRRDGVELEMNPYCRRAVAQAAILAAGSPGSEVVVLTLGPPAADGVLREAISWITACGVAATGVHVCGPEFAGSDTLATARALAAALATRGPFDLVLAGRSSVDADTGQVGPQLAQILDLPFATGVREMALGDRCVVVRCEHDDGWLRAELPLPAVLSVAERLCDPAKVDPEGRAAVRSELIDLVSGSELGPGPWGAAGSTTVVGRTRLVGRPRAGLLWPGDPLEVQVHAALDVLLERGSLDTSDEHEIREPVSPAPAPSVARRSASIAVIVEPDRDLLTSEILGEAASLAAPTARSVVALTVSRHADAGHLARQGADAVVQIVPAVTDDGGDPAAPLTEEDIAAAVTSWSAGAAPWAILAPSTAWGREISSRVAASLGAGLTGDAVGFELHGDRLVSWKPAFGGQLVVAVTATTPVQMATVRPGVLPVRAPRTSVPEVAVTSLPVSARGRVHVLSRERDDDLDGLAGARAVVGVGQAVPLADYRGLRPLLDALGAELGATRKVTDAGRLPRSRQIGITGRSIAPSLFVSIGARGSFNHVVGVRAAGTVLAINIDPEAPVFDSADVGIVGDWREVVPLLTAAVVEALGHPGAR